MANMHVIEHLGKYLDTLPIKILILFRAQLRSVYCQMSPVRPSERVCQPGEMPPGRRIRSKSPLRPDESSPRISASRTRRGMETTNGEELK